LSPRCIDLGPIGQFFLNRINSGDRCPPGPNLGKAGSLLAVRQAGKQSKFFSNAKPERVRLRWKQRAHSGARIAIGFFESLCHGRFVRYPRAPGAISPALATGNPGSASSSGFNIQVPRPHGRRPGCRYSCRQHRRMSQQPPRCRFPGRQCHTPHLIALDRLRCSLRSPDFVVPGPVRSLSHREIGNRGILLAAGHVPTLAERTLRFAGQ